jgi:tRNA dimethylallyltransferase
VRVGLDPERTALYDRLNRRAAQMFSRGLLEETQSLAGKYCPALTDCERITGFRSLGYRQCLMHMRGEITRDQALRLTQQGHRNYAKRQMTWFRREPQVQWLRGFGDDAALQASVTLGPRGD